MVKVHPQSGGLSSSHSSGLRVCTSDFSQPHASLDLSGPLLDVDQSLSCLSEAIVPLASKGTWHIQLCQHALTPVRVLSQEGSLLVFPFAILTYAWLTFISDLRYRLTQVAPR